MVELIFEFSSSWPQHLCTYPWAVPSLKCHLPVPVPTFLFVPSFPKQEAVLISWNRSIEISTSFHCPIDPWCLSSRVRCGKQMEMSNGSPPAESGLKEQANMSPNQISKEDDMQALERARSIHKSPMSTETSQGLPWGLQRWGESNCSSPPERRV